MKAASTVLTGGLGRRTERQRALILPTGRNTLAYLAYDASQSIPKPNSCLGSKVRPMALSAMWKEAQTHLFTLCQYWGAAESGRGTQKHATYSMSLESCLLNTGSSLRDAKVDGK